MTHDLPDYYAVLGVADTASSGTPPASRYPT